MLWWWCLAVELFGFAAVFRHWWLLWWRMNYWRGFVARWQLGWKFRRWICLLRDLGVSGSRFISTTLLVVMRWCCGEFFLSRRGVSKSVEIYRFHVSG
ncbi:hypothetical protein QL285_085956 [Trifolium repens]|nr:hypothetical protein QL285_085956 [Trifolium repens]